MVVLEKETQKFYAVDFETENMTKLWACLGVLRTESLDRKCGRKMSLTKAPKTFLLTRGVLGGWWTFASK